MNLLMDIYPGSGNNSPVGRPKKVITKELLVSSYKKLNDWYLVADHLGVSPSTVYRRLNEFGFKRDYSAK